MTPFRITTISAHDGKPTTMKFRSEALARETWVILSTKPANRAHCLCGALLEVRGDYANLIESFITERMKQVEPRQRLSEGQRVYLEGN